MRTTRTTVSLDPDTRLLIERAMSERGISFKAAINDAVRRGLGAHPGGAQRARSTITASLGEPRVNLDKAVAFAASMEDDERARDLAVRR